MGWLWTVRELEHADLGPPALVPLLVFPGLIVAALAGRPWARLLLLGWSTWIALDSFSSWLTTHASIHAGVEPRFDEGRAMRHAFYAVAMMLFAGGAALLAPWARRQIDRYGWALVLIGLAASRAWMQAVGTEPLGDLALIALVAAAVGSVLRTRWATALAVVAGVALAIVETESWWFYMRWGMPDHARWSLTVCLSPHACKAVMIGDIVVSSAAALAALASAVVGRRSAPAPQAPRSKDSGSALPDMRRRWLLLFAAAMTCLAAMSWSAGGFEALRYGGTRVVATCVCAAIGVYCAMMNVQRRWPAVVSTVLAVMVGLGLLKRIGMSVGWVDWFERVGASGVLGVVAIVAMVASSLFVAIRKLPAPPPIPLAHQR